MPQGVDAFAFFNAAFVLGAVIDLLGGAYVQGSFLLLPKKTHNTG